MNNREAMQKAFEGQKFKVFSPFKCDISKNEDGNYVDDETIFAFAWFCRGIASQAQQPDRITDVGETMQEPYAYDVPTQDGTELAYAIYYTKYNNPLPEGAIPLYASQQELVSQWISVEDQLPPRSTEVLVYPMLSAYSHVAWHDGDCWRVTEYEKYIGEVHTALSDGLITHWMPLPPAPEGGDK